MPLTACPECEGKVSDRAVVCPHCGHPLRSWRELLGEAWRDGVGHAWKAAVAFPAMYLVALFAIQPPHMVAPHVPRMLPWLVVLALQGFLAAATVAGAVALVRGMRRSGREKGIWIWSEYAVIGTILLGGFWIYTSLT